MVRLTRLAVVLLLLTLSSASSKAWNDSGHKLAADLAYRQLGVADRAKALAILTDAFADPNGAGLANFEQDLTAGLPSGATAAERDRHIFLTAATWPDVVRDELHPLHKEYHKSKWHYINLPFVPAGDSIAKPAEPVPTAAGQEPADVISAIAFCIADVKAAGTSKRVKAARLCFLLHLVGDIHQPLHAVAMFSDDKLKNGDQGGNLLLLRRRGIGQNSDTIVSVHAIFDGLFGSDSRLATIKAKGDVLERTPAFSNTALAAELAKKDPMDWAKESLADAIKYGYLDGNLKAHRGLSAKAFNEKHLNIADVEAIPAHYLANAHESADRRMALAGFRLASTLEEALK